MFKYWQKNSPTLGDLMLCLLVEDLSPFLRNKQYALLSSLGGSGFHSSLEGEVLFLSKVLELDAIIEIFVISWHASKIYITNNSRSRWWH